MLIKHGQTFSQQLQLLLVGKDIFLYGFTLGLACGFVRSQGAFLFHALL